MESEALMKILIGLFGYVLLMLGVILALHYDFTIGVIITASGFFMFWAMLPQYDERGRQELYWYDYFCSQNCYDNFANQYIQQVIAIAPRTECLETPIEDPQKTRHQSPYGNYGWNEWDIKVDTSRQS